MKWELKATIALKTTCSRADFHINHSSNLSLRTSIYFSVSEEEIAIERSSPRTLDSDKTASPIHRPNHEDEVNAVNIRDERGPHTLFFFDDEGSQGGERQQEIAEKLELHVFRDGSVLEVFANDRFTFSTMVYLDIEEEAGLNAFVESTIGTSTGTSAAIFEDVKVWET